MVSLATSRKIVLETSVFIHQNPKRYIKMFKNQFKNKNYFTFFLLSLEENKTCHGRNLSSISKLTFLERGKLKAVVLLIYSCSGNN